MIRIALADDQTLLREMLRMILSQDETIEVVGEAKDGDEILKVCRELKPDIVLLDIKMPEQDGIYALKQLKSEFPAIKVIMLTTFGDEKNVLQAWQAGADGYILKDIRPRVLLDSIKTVQEGFFVAHQSIHAILHRHTGISSSQKSAALEAYAQRCNEFGLDLIDLKIIKLLINGRNNKEIGEILNFSEGTIKNKISRILSNTGQKDRTGIVVFALQNNLI